MHSKVGTMMRCSVLFVTLLPTALCAPLAGLRAQVWTCGGAAASAQAWQLDSAGDATIISLVGSFNASTRHSLVLGAAGNEATGAQLVQNVSGDASQTWQWNASSGTLVASNGHCLGARATICGSSLFLAPCTSAPLQSWHWMLSTGTLSLRDDNALCLDARTQVSCADAPYSALPYCNMALDTEARLEDLVSRFDGEDFAQLLNTDGVGVPRWGVQLGVSQFAEALHGVWSSGDAPADPHTSSGNPTSFPHLLLLAASFNRSLWAAVANVIGDEAVAIRNANAPDIVKATAFFFNLNSFLYPTWGRGQEVPSDDAVLTAEFAAIFISSLQWGPDVRYKRLISVVKHYAAYDLDNLRPTGVPITRFNFDAQVPLGDLVSYYLVPFKAATQRGLAGGLMCSYNSVGGIPMCANGFLNNEIARGQWGWDGFIISDCGAFSLIWLAHVLHVQHRPQFHHDAQRDCRCRRRWRDGCCV